MINNENIRTLFEISCSTTFASIIGFFATGPPYSQAFLSATYLFGIITVLVLLIWHYLEKIDEYFWNFKMKYLYARPKIGILYEEKVRSHFTKVTPEEWKNKVESFHYKVKLISINEINDEYVLIINPYGETYPEEELIELKTFNKIKNYIKNGGLFINVAGIPFYYGFDYIHDLNPTLSKEEVTLLPINHFNVKVLAERQVYPPTGYSLVETVSYENFKILTTWGDTRNRECYQNDVCRKYVGDITNVGGNIIYEFRAIRKETRKWIPFLISNSDYGEIYPISGIPYEKGCLIVCGFNLNYPVGVDSSENTIHQGCIDKIVCMIDNIIKKRKNGDIPMSSEKW